MMSEPLIPCLRRRSKEEEEMETSSSLENELEIAKKLILSLVFRSS